MIDTHIWEPDQGAAADSFNRDWSICDDYRGTNSNMHLTEALLAGEEAGHRPELGQRARSIAEKLINSFARDNGWLLPEHYDAHWRVQMDFNRDHLDDPFRPFGATVGHSFEWARLVLSLGQAMGELDRGWYLDAATMLFSRAVDVGWDRSLGGIVYTVDWEGRVANPDRYWWTVAEAMAVADYLHRVTGESSYEQWQRQFLGFAADHLIDFDRGGWYPMLDSENHRKEFPWFGKPDVYHVFQATILPLLPLAPSVAGAVSRYLQTENSSS